LSRRLIIMAGLVFAGCARFHDHPLSPAQKAASLDSRRLDSPEFRRFAETNLARSFPEWPPKTWDFDLLTLAALYYQPSLDVARAQWATAMGGDRTAAQRPNPVLSVIPGNSFMPSTGPPWIPFVGLDFPVETAGKRKYRRSQAGHLTDAARMNLVTTAWQVRGNLRSSLIDLTGARRREALLKAQLAVQDRIVQSLEQRMDAGAVASSEVGLVRIAREKNQVEWLDARRVSAEDLVKVADAIGVPVAALEGLNLPETVPTPLGPGELTSPEVRRRALLSRADILGALAEYAASQAALQLEIAKQYPDIHLGPGYQFDQGDQKVTFGVTVDLPVLSQNQGPIAEAEGRRAEAEARFIAVQARAITEIDGAVTSYRAVTDQLTRLESLAFAQQKQNDMVAAQVQAGAADPIDLLNAQLELSVSELARLDGRVKLQQALGALEDAFQQPLATLKPSLFEQSPRPPAMTQNHP
jgi:outer membrane protein, heavy metal efflux system